ncbi:hypothetical protein [Thaumasiovibrio subtropicus]|uniref:hypothetical protein n=1 Tax=Thaumasiovibrio subtropicus TaxID=1891207 RepID=UPI000B35A52B|nr:hypothetical protein [Thaumasiovibrio subtropicus]
MFQQTLSAQLARMAALLLMSLVAVHHCQPLLHALAEQAMASGCHAMEATEHHGLHHSMHHDMSSPVHHSPIE